MKPYFAGHPAATALFAGTLAVWVIIELRQALKRRPEASKKDHGSRFVIVLCIGGAFILAARARADVTGAAFLDNPTPRIVSASSRSCGDLELSDSHVGLDAASLKLPSPATSSSPYSRITNER